MMKKFVGQFPAYAIGVYLATGLMDGIWNPLHWSGKQWASAVLAVLIVLIGAWGWNRWKAKRG